MSWILLSSGRGPGECQIAVKHLIQAIQTEAAQSNVTVELIDIEEGEHGPLSAVLSVTGLTAVQFAQSWRGSIKWICPSPIRKMWPRKNWFVSVTLLEEPKQEAQFNTRDIRFETFRASGPGGQHVNKTESAVRVIHIPTGIACVAKEERSQHRNKALALARLAEAIASKNTEANKSAERAIWAIHDEIERGNSVRVYEGSKFRRTS
jgi:peptide chain release factor